MSAGTEIAAASSEPQTVVLRFPADTDQLARLSSAFPLGRFLVASSDDALSQVLPQATVVIGGYEFSAELAAISSSLRWMQLFGAGLDAVHLPARPNLRVTNARGVAAPAIAEHVMALMLSFARALPELARRQSEGRWSNFHDMPATFELSGQTLLIVGYGAVGRAVALRATSFGMRVSAVRRDTSATDDSDAEVHPPDHLPRLLPRADHVVLALPHTPKTAGLFGGAALAAMKPSAFLYNVGRGQIVDHQALLSALLNRRISGAGLDVTDPEPLPPESPLWTLPNVVLTSHSSGQTPHLMSRLMRLVIQNLEHYSRGESLLNELGAP